MVTGSPALKEADTEDGGCLGLTRQLILPDSRGLGSVRESKIRWRVTERDTQFDLWAPRACIQRYTYLYTYMKTYREGAGSVNDNI